MALDRRLSRPRRRPLRLHRFVRGLGQGLVLSSLVLWSPSGAAIPACAAVAQAPGDEHGEARRALREQRWADAEGLFRQLLLERPDDRDALLGWARSLEAQGRGSVALGALTRAASEEIEGGTPGVAAELYGVASAIAPENPELSARHGRALLLARRFDEAVAPLERALSGAERPAAAVALLAAAYWETSRFDEAETLYREAAERDPSGGRYRHELARLLLWRERYEEAVTLLGELAAAPGRARDFGFQLDLARALEGAARAAAPAERASLLDRAERAYARCADLAPEHSEVRYGWARVLQRLGAAEEAREQLRRYRELQSEDQERTRQRLLVEARLDRAWELLRAGESEAAAERFAELPESPDSLHGLALARRALGDPGGAQAALRRALALAPDRTDLRALLEEL